MGVVEAVAIIHFWREAGPDKWFSVDKDFDLVVRSRFLGVHEAAARLERAVWEENADGALALLILLDQFPRNMFRGSAHAFATDLLARRVTKQALVREFDRSTDPIMRQFFYLPFMHSEDLADQDRSLQLYEELGEVGQLKYAVIHRDIIVQFGRFPHRNRALGRETTQAERKFLDDGGFAGRFRRLN